MQMLLHKLILCKSIASYIAVAILLFLRAEISLGRSQQDSLLPSLHNRAYPLTQSNPNESISLSEQAAKIDLQNVTVRRQLGYLYESQGKHDEALKQLYVAENINSSDTIKLQIGYILAAMNQIDDANQVFDKLLFTL